MVGAVVGVISLSAGCAATDSSDVQRRASIERVRQERPYALVEEGLKTTAADTAPADGTVSASEWLDYAAIRVPRLQLSVVRDARRQGRDVVFGDADDQGLQRPRVFYRREAGVPLLVARPPAKP